MPVGRLIKSGGMKAVRQFYESLGQQFVSALDEMIVFDAVICNTDRHYGNFGVLVDSDTNKIVAPDHYLTMGIHFLILQARKIGKVKKSFKIM